MAAKEFWQFYLKEVVEEMVKGEQWYDFSMASLRTFRELGLARKCGTKFHVVEYEGYRININPLGRVINIVRGCKIYRRNSLPCELFIISLPIQNIEAR